MLYHFALMILFERRKPFSKSKITILPNRSKKLGMVIFWLLLITTNSKILSTIIIGYAISLSNPVKPIKDQYINTLISHI